MKIIAPKLEEFVKSCIIENQLKYSVVIYDPMIDLENTKKIYDIIGIKCIYFDSPFIILGFDTKEEALIIYWMFPHAGETYVQLYHNWECMDENT